MTIHYCRKCGTETKSVDRNGEQREVCQNSDCKHVYWNNPVPVLAGIVEYNGDIVLIQNQGWPDHWYGLVTGFLEKGEDPEDGIVREIQEELGLDARVIEFVGTYSFFERNELILAYHLKASGEIKMGEELSDYKIIPIDKVKPWPFATGLALGDWLKRRKEA